jgi:hypothetical protein
MGLEREQCLQNQRAPGAAGSSSAGTGGTLGSGTGIGNSTLPTAPIGSPSGSVR